MFPAENISFADQIGRAAKLIERKINVPTRPNTLPTLGEISLLPQ
jgi:hypothetical protein